MDFQVFFESYMVQYGRKTEALFHALKDDITGGRLVAGTRLPSTRDMASRYGLSRGTVNVVYDRLGSEGYVSSNVGSGTYVVFRHQEQKAAGDKSKFAPHKGSLPQISRWARRIDEMPLLRAKQMERRNHDQTPVEFLLGKVDLNSFPANEWNRLMFEQVRSMYGFQLKDAFESGGHSALLESIALHLRRSRGLMIGIWNCAIQTEFA